MRIPYIFYNIYYLIIGFIWMQLKYKNIWSLKASYQRHLTNLKQKIYYHLFNSKYKGSWIGINSYFESVPIFPHGINGIFISDKARIGRDVVIFHQVTIGSNTLEGTKTFGSPKIGNEVYIGCGAKIIGGISVGDNCRIGANTVIVKDIPQNSTIVMEEPRIIVRTEIMNNKFKSINEI